MKPPRRSARRRVETPPATDPGGQDLLLAHRADRLAGQTEAGRLATHPAVVRVRHAGTMIAFELPDAGSADRFCGRLRLIVHATSLGGVESLVERRASAPGDAHVPPGLIRFSIGLEDPEDLWRDLVQALG